MAIPISLHGVIGRSEGMQDIFVAIHKVARTDTSVLLVGESGTGKERVAYAIHQESARREKPFVVINCPAIPETLLESELFGYEKGSFTGASVTRGGKISTAAGGTLFLDELGEMPLTIQVKLLRFLQEHVIEPVGGRARVVDVRVIAATNRNLKEAIITGRFREDLYYRLSVVTLTLPPLRERGEDILCLAHAFLDGFCKAIGKKINGFSKTALRLLETYSWPGNIREMENRIHRAVIMAEEGSEIVPRDIEISLENGNRNDFSLKKAQENCQRELISKALMKFNGNMSQTARELQISRPVLYDIVKKLNLNRRYRRASDKKCASALQNLSLKPQ